MESCIPTKAMLMTTSTAVQTSSAPPTDTSIDARRETSALGETATADISHCPCHTSLELNNLAVSLLQAEVPRDALSVFQIAWDDYVSASSNGHRVTCKECCLRSLNQTTRDSLIAQMLMMPGLYSSAHFLPINVAANAFFEKGKSSIRSVALAGNEATVGVPDNQDLTNSPSNYFAMFNRAFSFEDTDHPSSNGTFESSLEWTHKMQLLPVVILFNTGLTYHRMALNTAGKDEFVKAFRFYELALKTIDEKISRALRSSDYNLLQLALYNNMGYIHSHFFNEKETMVCAGRLLATFASIDCSTMLSKEEYVFYYMNLLFLLNRSPVFAPAA